MGWCYSQCFLYPSPFAVARLQYMGKKEAEDIHLICTFMKHPTIIEIWQEEIIHYDTPLLPS